MLCALMGVELLTLLPSIAVCTEECYVFTLVSTVAQGLLCGVLQVVIQKLSENDSAKTGLLEKADSIMQALLGVFQCHAGSVHEEAMLAVGALTYACGQSFTKYMQSFYPVLKLGLENHRVSLQDCHHCLGLSARQRRAYCLT